MLQVHITDFLSYCKVVGFSKKSTRSLARSLRDFDSFIHSQAITDIGGINYALLVDFVSNFRKPSVHLKKARVWCLHQFFHFLTVNGEIPENIATGLEYPKIEKTVPHFLTAEEYNKIIIYFALDAHAPIGMRNLVMVLLLGTLGVRTSTLIALNIEDIDIEAGLALVHEKGDKKRLMVLPDMLVQILELYLNRLNHSSGPLFRSVRKKRISQRTLQDVLHTVACDLNIDRSLHPRLFRHTAATLLNKTAGTTITQAVLGHARRNNTLRYTHLNPDQYAVYMRCHPFMQEGRS